MGKAFFTGWALWEKMTFVLACCIVVTILLGLLKLSYSTWRINKLVKNPPKKNELHRDKSIIRSLSSRPAISKTERREMAERRRKAAAAREATPQVPFGIRAIESGIEVDGVWISRTNTPTQTPAQTPLLSAAKPTWGGSSVDLSDSEQASQDTSLMPPRSPPRTHSPHGKYPPHSYMRYEGGRNKRQSRTSRSPNPMRGSDYDPQEYDNNYSHYESKRSSGSDSDPQEFDSMQNHRMTNAAEMGQLQPRTRKPTHSMGEMTPSSSMGTTLHEATNFSRRRSTSPHPPSEFGGTASNPFSTPASEFHPGFGGAGTSSTPSTRRPSEQSFIEDEAAYEVAPGGGPVGSRRTSSIPGTYRPDSTVLREVNTGFAVLKPGTLPVRRPSEDDEDKPRGRRLQKKRRQSETSTAGSTSRHTIMDPSNVDLEQGNGPEQAYGHSRRSYA